MTYTFGHTDLAAVRLALVAEVFAPATEPFLRDCVTTTPKLVVDLGCGPGYSTQLLAGVLQPEEIVGLDFSESFLAMARTSATDRMRFQLHDITAVPFPLPTPAELIYSRFELPHLPEPERIVANWATQLRPGGLLLLEEVEDIQTTNPTLARYLEILDAMLQHQGNRLYIGRVLDALEAPSGTRRQHSQVRQLAVPSPEAARMFSMNLQMWREQPFVREGYAPEEIAHLQEALALIANRPTGQPDIVWHMRQIALERVR